MFCSEQTGLANDASNPLGLRDLMTASKSRQWNNVLCRFNVFFLSGVGSILWIHPTSCRLLSANAWSAAVRQKNSTSWYFRCLQEQAIFYTWPGLEMQCHFHILSISSYHHISSVSIPFSCQVDPKLKTHKNTYSPYSPCWKGMIPLPSRLSRFEHRNPSPVQEIHGNLVSSWNHHGIILGVLTLADLYLLRSCG